ncbi:MAG: glutamine synthetase III [Christensenellales bacterium]
MKNVTEIFGSLVFNDKVMRERLPQETYKALKRTIFHGEPLSENIADTVADAMKEWAIEHGATHYTHWFQPMTGITAEKHDSFISPTKDGRVIMEFTGKSLIKGEPDASSFPCGSLRATFEARGYTAWDPTSYAFIKDKSLYIPTAFWSYSGEVLDKKTPLLKSMQAINKQTMRILRLFGTSATNVNITVGAEQEYFLIDRNMFRKRPDLIYCGRTLFGAKPPKGQDLDDHYFGAIKPKISDFMCELDEKLWELGVFAKTKHNEVAPSQHEIAPVFTTANTATDHNQITMETLRTLADKHNLACLLHEKPFVGVNGSGKHLNWSMSTNKGRNLLEPGDTPEKNAQFLLFLTAIIKAVDLYQDLLRLSVSTAANDHRLGANEAPPAIVSIFLGNELTDILTAIETKSSFNQKAKLCLEVGVDTMPKLPKDTTDRNRTSPFAFTGNKFEFRMPGSSLNIASPIIVLNTIVADILSQFADQLEKTEDFTAELNNIIRDTIKNHKRIIFNGNNYSQEWIEEAKRRGLLNLKNTLEALPEFKKPKNLELFKRHNIFTEQEISSRQEILYANYCKTIHIEALTMLDMVKKGIVPAVISFSKELSELILNKKSLNMPVQDTLEKNLLDRISQLSFNLDDKINALEKAVSATNGEKNSHQSAKYYHDKIFLTMQELREIVDELETIVGKDYWPYPSYGDILYSVS